MERILQRKVVYGVIGGLIGILAMVPVLLVLVSASLLHLPQLILVLLGPPSILGLFCARAAEKEYKTRRRWSLVLLSVSYLILVTAVSLGFGYMIFAIGMSE